MRGGDRKKESGEGGTDRRRPLGRIGESDRERKGRTQESGPIFTYILGITFRLRL